MVDWGRAAMQQLQVSARVFLCILELARAVAEMVEGERPLPCIPRTISNARLVGGGH